MSKARKITFAATKVILWLITLALVVRGDTLNGIYVLLLMMLIELVGIADAIKGAKP